MQFKHYTYAGAHIAAWLVNNPRRRQRPGRHAGQLRRPPAGHLRVKPEGREERTGWADDAAAPTAPPAGTAR